MSFVIAAPELVSAAATDLENLGSTISAARSAAAGSTTALLPAAQDEVSAAIAALFGAHGTAFQALSAQAAAFHEEFVRVLNAGAGAYLSTELANAQQNLLNAVNAPVQGLLGHSAAASSLAAARTAALPLLGGGGLGSILGIGAPVGHGINGVVTALHNGSAVSLLSGQIGAVPQSLSGGIAGLPTGLTALQHALAPGLLAPAASHGLASVAGPYETLFANTVANLETLGRAIAANPAPFLHQFIANQIHYAQEIAAGVTYVIQHLPAVLASVPAHIQAAIHALLTFNPVQLIERFIAHQVTYAQIIATALNSAAHDFTVGLRELPAAFLSAVQALAAGNINGAVGDIGQGFLRLFFTGFDVTTTGDLFVAPGLTTTITPTGTLGDLLPIFTIPGMMAQNFTNLLPPGSIPAQISQNFTNVINTRTDTSIHLNALASFSATSPLFTAALTANFGLPVALTLERLGAPFNALSALGSSATAFVHELQTGNPIGAFGTLIDTPAVVTNAFLNGRSTLPLTFTLYSNGPTIVSATVNLPLDGILVPQAPLTSSVTGESILIFLGVPIQIGPLTIPVTLGGTPLSGLATGSLVFAPEQLALAITPPR